MEPAAPPAAPFPVEPDHLPPLPQDRTPGIGCVGAGFIMADCHLVAYRANGLNPVAIHSRTPATARAVAERHSIARAHETLDALLDDPAVEVLDVAVPPDAQIDVVRRAVAHPECGQGKRIRGILAQKPLGVSYGQARDIVEMCESAGVVLAVNQNMRFDHSIRACRALLDRGELGEPVLATIDMRAVPHWMPWQERQGWVSLRIMSIHHLDAFRYLLGDPDRIHASVRPDPRTAKKFAHEDGICLYTLEFPDGARAQACDDVWTGPALEGAEPEIGIRWRVEGTEGLALGTIGWPGWPERVPSTLDWSSVRSGGRRRPRWPEAWFPDAFVGPMADLLIALERGTEPTIGGRDNLKTMALVDAAYLSAREKRAVAPLEVENSARVR